VPDGFPFLLAALYLSAVCGIIAWVDAWYAIIPNRLNAALAAGGVVFAAFAYPERLPSALAGSALGFAALLSLRMSYRALRQRDGLGLGDVKFLGAAGLWVGWQGLAPLLLAAAATALTVVSVGALAGRGPAPDERLPFGPYLALATILVWTLEALDLAPWRIA
jgi:leader peptidase (prepilin peptidase)/N-methyltransferase